MMDPSSQGAKQAGLDNALIGLLSAVEREDPCYYEPLSPESSTHEQLCDLESLGYIHYCPYPEEFWVILPTGKEFLSKLFRGL
jgi:hypothetical protein